MFLILRNILRNNIELAVVKGAERLESQVCICCKQKKATLPLDNGEFICEECAQVMNDLAN